MLRFIISDLHLNSWEDNTNIDGIKLFFEKLLKYKNSFELFILGDLLECSQGNYKEILKFHKEIFNLLYRISKKKKVLISLFNGNHDDYKLCDLMVDIDLKKTMVYNFYIEDNIYYSHGREFDPLFRDKESLKTRFLERAIKYFGKIEKKLKLNKNDIDDNFISNYYHKKIQEKAVNFKKNNGYNKVIFGHTHIFESNKNYINTGCMTLNNTDITILNKSTGLFQVFKDIEEVL